MKQSYSRRKLHCVLLVVVFVVKSCTLIEAAGAEREFDEQHDVASKTQVLPANHKMLPEKQQAEVSAKSFSSSSSSLPPHSTQSSKHHKKSPLRQARQYDAAASAMSAAGSSASAGYAALAGDSSGGSTYAASGALPLMSGHSGASGYGSGVSSAYGPYGSASQMDAYGGISGHNDWSRGYQQPPPPVPLGYPSMPPAAPFGGMFSSAASNSPFPLISKMGFDVSEIVCTAIAVALGAVIIGAPFVLIYLFVMNQMQPGGPAGPGAGVGGGSISLTGPTSSTTVSGRKKRHASLLPETLLKQLGPLVDNEQLQQTLKTLVRAMAKYSNA